MIVSSNWLAELLPTHVWEADTIASPLTFAGLEVEHIHDQAAGLTNMVVGKVVDVQPHPKADRLRVCTVDVASDTYRTIVCGAPNVETGQTVAVALPGACIPGTDFTIEERQLRGVASQGMICSQAELQMGDDSDGIWVLPDGLTIGQPLAIALGQTDVLLDVAITPNRADALSHLGMAREIAVLLDPLNANLPGINTPNLIVDPTVPPCTVLIENLDLCQRFYALPISGISVGPSPDWMQQRLTACGMRPRNVVVDVTNYVMLELGQPLHAYDARTVTNRTFVVRTASTSAPFTTLDGKVRNLQPNMLMICDSQQPLGIAGVMGGEHSEIANDTVDVLLESAVFLPSSIRKTSKVLDIQSDAAYRFERGVDPEMARVALLRAAALIAELAGGLIGPISEARGLEDEIQPIKARFARFRSLLGTNVENTVISAFLNSIGCKTVSASDADITVVPPSWRVDISCEVDLIEEVMRLVTIDNIPVPPVATFPVLQEAMPEHVRRSSLQAKLVHVLVNQGYYDCCTTSQTKPEYAALSGARAVTLRNPLGRDGSVMRTSLIPGLVSVVSHNLRQGASTIRVAEAGRVFEVASNELGTTERRNLAFAVAGTTERQWAEPVRQMDYYDIVGTAQAALARCGIKNIDVAACSEAPSRLWSTNVGVLRASGKPIGIIGQVSLELTSMVDVVVPVFAVELCIDDLQARSATFVQPSSYPLVERDMALIVASTTLSGTVVDIIENNRPAILSSINIFDVFGDERYVGAGMKSIGIRLTFSSSERTLVDADVDSAVEVIYQAVHKHCGATLRGAQQPNPSSASSE